MNSYVVLTSAVLMISLVAVSSNSPAVKVERLEIETSSGIRSFDIELVREEAERNRGLMYRKSMPASHGMLFDYDPPQSVGFWMKNTYISLDIIFIAADGRIIRIAEHTEPLSLEHIPSGGPVRGVFEINAGLSQKLGIRAGDFVRHPLFRAGNERGPSPNP